MELIGSVVSLEHWDTSLIPGHNGGLRIQHFCNCRIGHDCGSDQMPCPGTSHALVAKKEKDYLKVVLGLEKSKAGGCLV